ncbi:alkane 1-monooxygenase [Spongiibacter nanhainus]|nr:alkane 1-monooxygenase [Spongiibacter nanhainus]
MSNLHSVSASDSNGGTKLSLANMAWISSKKYLYLLSLVIPLIPIAAGGLAMETGNGLWFWSLVIFVYFLFPFADYLMGEDPANPDESLTEALASERYYARLMYLSTALHWVAVFYSAYAVASRGLDWGWFNILGAALSLGVANGLALTAGHEMGHKIKDRRQMTAAKLILACCGYGHFSIEHNKGHHKDVATPEDPASSRLGENIYSFVLREIPGAAKRAWILEKERLNRLGKATWSFSNEILQPAAVTLLAYAAIIALFGWLMVPFLIVSAAYGWWQLTCANYTEHYGLLRQKTESGRYERCQPHHSWNSNSKASNLLLLHLQRHSDHHAHPTRPYQVLRDYEDVPTLPFGYPGMFALAMVPPLWFAIMNPRVIAWAGGDLSKINVAPSKRKKFEAMNPQRI